MSFILETMRRFSCVIATLLSSIYRKHNHLFNAIITISIVRFLSNLKSLLHDMHKNFEKNKTVWRILLEKVTTSHKFFLQNRVNLCWFCGTETGFLIVVLNITTTTTALSKHIIFSTEKLIFEDTIKCVRWTVNFFESALSQRFLVIKRITNVR